MAFGFVGNTQGTVVHMGSGISSAGVPVECKSSLSISGDFLTIVLENTSLASFNPNDIIGSYYFDVVNGLNTRPTLSYLSATGDVWLTNQMGVDSLITPGANLKATAPGDNTWQYKPMNAGLAPFLGFGVGTVGNANLNPNNFMGNIVDGMDYAIYVGDVTTNNLHNRLLVKGPITFTFSGVSGFSESDISQAFACGMGTAPDSLITPEPASIALLGLGCLAMMRRRVR